MKTFLKKINWKVSAKTLIGVFVIVLIFFLMPEPAAASWITEKLILGIGWILYAIVYALGAIMMIVINLLTQILSWQDFTELSVVVQGWTVLRDVCNMFFIIGILIIAFSTILGLENYSIKKNFPKLILMAVLINFSRMICGVIIDAGQIIMLTFAAGFTGGGTNNLANLVGMKDMMSTAAAQLDDKNNAGATEFQVFAGIILAFAASLIAFIAILAIFVTLLARAVMIWIYVILSPLAYLLAAFPSGQRYSQMWWSDFMKNVIVGPVLAFFLWLALSTADSVGTLLADQGQAISSTGIKQGIVSGFLDNKVLQTYIITIGLLVGGLMITQKIGGAAGFAAGKAMSKIQQGGKWIANKGSQAVGKVAALPGKAAVGAKDIALGKLAQNDWVKNKLGAAGGFQGKTASGRFGAGVLGVMGFQKLATKSLIGLEGIDKKKREKAEGYVSNIKDTRILSRLADNKTYTPWQREVRDAARNKRGYHSDNGVIEDDINKMDYEDIQKKINRRQMVDIGGNGIQAQVGTDFEEYLHKNRTARAAYAKGAVLSGNAANAISGLDRNGRETGDYGFSQNTNTYIGDLRAGRAPTVPLPIELNSTDPNLRDVRGLGNLTGLKEYRYSRRSDDLKYEAELAGQSSGGPVPVSVVGQIPGGDMESVKPGDLNVNNLNNLTGDGVGLAAPMDEKLALGVGEGATAPIGEMKSLAQYSVATKVPTEEREEARGSGNLSINGFSRNGAEAIGVDFEKLNIEGMDKDGQSDFRNIAGVQTNDAGEIKKIASKLVGVIDQEISALKNKGTANLSGGEQQRLVNLNEAKKGLSQPEALKTISLVNSSASNYKVSDVKRTKIHEEMHGMGYEDEDDVRYATQKIIDTKQYGKRDSKESLDEIISTRPKTIKNMNEELSPNEPK